MLSCSLTCIHRYIHHRKNNINEFRRPQNIQTCQYLKFDFFHDYNTFQYGICSEIKKNIYIKNNNKKKERKKRKKTKEKKTKVTFIVYTLSFYSEVTTKDSTVLNLIHVL